MGTARGQSLQMMLLGLLMKCSSYMAFYKKCDNVSQICEVNKTLKSRFAKHQIFPTSSRDEHSHLVFEKLKLTYFPQDHQVLLTSICVHIRALFLSLVENFYNIQMLCVGCRLQWWTLRLLTEGRWILSMSWIFLCLNIVPCFNFQAV